MAFRTNELSALGLRRALSLELFTSPESVDWWNFSRAAFEEELTDPLGRQFVRVVDEEALRAVAAMNHRRLHEEPKPNDS
jgi:hypothetical protein